MSSEFKLERFPIPWLGGEPRVLTVSEDDNFPEHWPAISETRLVDIQYDGGGFTSLFDNIAEACEVPPGGFQSTMEHLEDLSHDKPLVIVVRRAHYLLADVGPALITVITGWERFCRHASGVSAMYLVLEVGPRAGIDAAFHPGGALDWLPRQ